MGGRSGSIDKAGADAAITDCGQVVFVGVGQLLQVVKAGIRPCLHRAQAQGVGLIAPLARQAVGPVAVLVDELRQLPLGVVDRRTDIRNARQPAHAGQLTDGVVAVGHDFALRARIAARVGEAGALVRLVILGLEGINQLLEDSSAPMNVGNKLAIAPHIAVMCALNPAIERRQLCTWANAQG